MSRPSDAPTPTTVLPPNRTAAQPHVRPTRVPYNPFNPPLPLPPSDASWLGNNRLDVFAVFKSFSDQHTGQQTFSKANLPEILRDDIVNDAWEEIFVASESAANRPWPVN